MYTCTHHNGLVHASSTPCTHIIPASCTSWACHPCRHCPHPSSSMLWTCTSIMCLGAAGNHLWNSCILRFAFLKFLFVTHEFSSLGYPTHFTKYCSTPLHILESRTSSTSYSTPFGVITGSGGAGFCCMEDVGVWAGCRRTVLNTGWMFLQVGGRHSL